MKKKDANAEKRFVDQPGQWRDVTPKSVKERQQKAWKSLLAQDGKNGTKTTKKK